MTDYSRLYQWYPAVGLCFGLGPMRTNSPFKQLLKGNNKLTRKEISKVQDLFQGGDIRQDGPKENLNQNRVSTLLNVMKKTSLGRYSQKTANIFRIYGHNTC